MILRFVIDPPEFSIVLAPKETVDYRIQIVSESNGVFAVPVLVSPRGSLFPR